VSERAVAARKDARIKLHEILTRLLTEGGFSGTRKQVCAAVGISPSALSQMARGQTKPSLETLVRLADFFRVSLDYLVLGEQSAPPTPATDYGPLARYIDLSLARLQAQSDERVDLVARIGRALAEQIEHVAREVASASPSLAGVLRDEETMLLEAYSVQTWIFSMNLHYDIILTRDPPPSVAARERPTRSAGAAETSATGGAGGAEAGVEAAGRFLPVVAQNLGRGRHYRFLLPAAVRDWRPVVQSYRTLLTKDLPNAQSVLHNCPFRVTTGPGVASYGLYQLDLAGLEREAPLLFAQVRHAVSEGWLGYVIPPSRELQADALMDRLHLEQARRTFAELWRRAQPL
jgi:transcriptional regulator with XRE-family HTH domain